MSSNHKPGMHQQELLDALSTWLEVREDKLRWVSVPIEDHHMFQSEFQRLRDAEDNVAEALSAYIDARIAAALEAHESNSRSGQNKSSSSS